MGQKEQPRTAAGLLVELPIVERREPGLAEAGGENDESAPPAVVRASVAKACERLHLHRVWLGRGLHGVDDELPGGERVWSLACSLRVGLDPRLVERAGRGPEGFEGTSYACIRLCVALTVDAEIPLDPRVQRGPREVAAPDEGNPVARRLERPRLRMKRPRQPGQLRDLDDARLDRTWAIDRVLQVVRVSARPALLPVDQSLERRGLGDVQVVARDDSHPCAAPDGGVEIVLDAGEPAVLDEGRDNRDIGGGREERQDVPRKGILHASGRERRRTRRPHVCGTSEVVPLTRDDVPDAATRVVHVAAVSGDDMHMKVHHGLPRSGPRVEADIVAVGLMRLVEPTLHLVHEGEDRATLVVGSVEPGGYHASRDDERMPLRHGEPVFHRERERVRGHPRGRRDAQERARAFTVRGPRHGGEDTRNGWAGGDC